MIAAVIRWSIRNRPLVLIVTAFLVVAGVLSVRATPVDALPDLSDVQVIIKTSYPGQAPKVVEDQVTYPLTTAMLAVPKAVSVRGFSFFGDSYVYVVFEDGTDLYWARSRVLEYLNQVSPELPETARPALGPDATGVGWIFQYALVDRSGRHDIADLRSLQDWFLKYELQAVPGVAEVATIGGMLREYQVVVDPDRLRAHSISLAALKSALRDGNRETGGAVVEMGEAEYMVRASGYLGGVEDLANVPVGVSAQGTPLRLADLADIRVGPQIRRGIADLDGEGEVTGGVIVMRWGGNAAQTIERVKQKLEALEPGLPDGVEIVTTYDRSQLIERAVETLNTKLIQEFLIVASICAVFLLHLRSSLIIVLSLPVGILAAFIVMRWQGINANIMSLGGIAIAIGVMVDSAIVMIENVHKRIEREPMTAVNRWQIVGDAATEVGRPLFFSLLITTLSFLPVFTLEAQEGRLFTPLALTKTYAMAAAALISVTLVPVLMGYFIRGRMRPEQANPINRALLAVYRPVIDRVIRFPRLTLLAAAGLVVVSLWPLGRLGTEFMPALDEGDLMYMPTTDPGLSVDKARAILQQTNKLIRTVPEVERVFGKIGRADTATDPAPLTMIETSIKLKPRSEWREGLTPDGLRRELDRVVQVPGLKNVWVMPIKTRIDMLATGVKTPLGIRISGPELDEIERIGRDIEAVLAELPGTASVFAERVAGGRYVDIKIDRLAASRFGLNVSDVHDVVGLAIGGMDVTRSVEGRERYPISLRYPQRVRDSIERLRLLPVVTPAGAHIALGDVADITVAGGLFARLVGAIRVSVTRQGTPVDRRTADAGGDRVAVVPEFPELRAGCDCRGHFAAGLRRRHLAFVPARLRVVGCGRGRIYRPRRGGRGNWRRDAGLPGADLQSACRGRGGWYRDGTPGRHRRRAAPAAADRHDGCRNHRRTVAHYVRRRHRLGGDAPHCGADGRRHGQCNAADAGRNPGAVSIVARSPVRPRESRCMSPHDAQASRSGINSLSSAAIMSLSKSLRFLRRRMRN